MFVEAWIKSREEVDGARRIRNDILRKHQYREGYVRSLERMKVKWDVKHMLEQVKQAMAESAREICEA